jgi:hypothetical protein
VSVLTTTDTVITFDALLDADLEGGTVITNTAAAGRTVRLWLARLRAWLAVRGSMVPLPGLLLVVAGHSIAIWL